MYHNATGKVNDTPAQEESIGMPRHVGERTIDKKEEEHHKEHVGREPDTLGE